MSNCSDCFNGCAEIVSDRCVKYTGVDVPILGIKKGDSLSYVEQALITFLTATLDGSGITITIDPADYCELVTQYLQACETVTALDLFKALVKAACDLQVQVDAIDLTLTTLNATYNVDCLVGLTGNEGTHDILQAVILKLCEVDAALTALALDVTTNYVKLSNLNTLIAAFIDGAATTAKAYQKMIPYAAVEYYGPISNFPNPGDGFDGAGVGLAYWDKVYLCNGDNGTPDKRGRVAVGATTTPSLIPFDPNVDPGIIGNPTYTQGGEVGLNTATLTLAQIPSHAHTASSVSAVSPNPHSHSFLGVAGSSGSGDSSRHSVYDNQVTGSTNLSVSTSTTVDPIGGSGAHSNVQPGIGAFYIMYIP